MEMPVIAKNISKDYKVGNAVVHALKPTTLEIEQGSIVVIIGKSGSGKSTLLNLLGGLLVPDTGRVMIDGKDLYKLSESGRSHIRNQKIGFIYQGFNLINELSVINNIRLPFDIVGKPYDLQKERELLSILGLEDRIRFYPQQLSGGERQRTAAARALLMEPSVILADEPTGNLDLESGNKLKAFIRQANEEKGQTFVIVTHDLDWINIAHTVYRMSDGILKREVRS